MKRVGAMVSVLALFATGILIGGLAVHIYHARTASNDPGHWQGPRPGFGPGSRGPWPLHRLERQLDLSADQVNRIREILRESRSESEMLREELRPRVREQMERTRGRIREVLTAQQQQRFDELHRREHRRAERFFLGHPGPPPGRDRRPESR